MNEANSVQPLANVTVIDLGSYIAGPYTAMMLGDLGATVIKVERPPHGDPFRFGGYSSAFRAYNRNKYSVALDYFKPEGARVLRRMVASADVVITNWRPGVSAGLGIDYETARQSNSRLIFCSITGFGETGPYAALPAFDTVGQALSGFLAVSQGREDARLRGLAVADTVTAMTATQATLAALYERERTCGRLVSVNLVESMLAFTAEPISRSINEGAATDEYSRASESLAFAVTCKDHQRIGIHLSSRPKFWDALIRALNAPELGADDRFIDRQARVSNYEALAGELQRRFMLRNRDEWIPILQQNDVPFAPAYEIADVASDPHISTTGAFVDVAPPGIGPITMVERPFRFDDSRGVPHVPPPFLGQHNELLLKRFGLTETEMSDLKEAKVIL